MMGFFEESCGKKSAKRLCGIIAIFVGLLMSIISGFHFYEIELGLIITVLSTGTALLGVGVLKRPANAPVQPKE